MDVPPRQLCDTCNRNEHMLVLNNLPSGEQEEVLACDDCEARYEKVQFLRIRLDEILYILDEYPNSWINDVTLHGLFDGEQATLQGKLSLDEFPLIEDFEIVLGAFVKKHLLEKIAPEYKVQFFSPSYGYLAHFSSNNTAQDLCRENFVVPCGTLICAKTYKIQNLLPLFVA